MSVLPPAAVKQCLIELIDLFNQEVKAAAADPFSFAAWVSFEFVSIHPFRDANGRLSRMLMNAALFKLKIPLPLAFGLSSHHSKATNHYQQCLIDARKRGGKTFRLNVVVLQAFYSVATSGFENIRLAYPKEYPKSLGQILSHLGGGS